ncbi:MAG: formate dehydrogenase subunit delta [Acidobacteriota bacterium]|nr:formate dehydrogenase subunit delta [Acidobacteriota bacterium]
MQTSTMVHNANQIALFFAGYPHDEAVAGVANHFREFWERRMKEQILQYIANDGSGLHPLVVEALQTKPGA